MLHTNTTIQGISRELRVLRKTSSGWRIVDYMFSSSERAGP
jgi:hypothetical protein